jgi:enoyl-CoA hydratase/carnithine racemase
MAVIEVREQDRVLTVTLNRPERLNALGREVREGLEAAVTQAAGSTARVVVLGGAGRAFSAGADLKDPDVASPDASWQQRRRASGRWGRLLDALEALPQVTVAALHGHVIGGAALLAAACDLRVAAPNVSIAIPEVAIGIPLTWAGIPRLVREIGVPRTRELVLTGRRLAAEEALGWGFVHRVGDLETEVERIVGELLAMPEAPLGMSKDALRAAAATVVSVEAAWADPDLLDASRREEESAQAGAEYLRRLGDKD